jgi:hypothetical protein
MSNLTALAGLTVSGAGISYLPVEYFGEYVRRGTLQVIRTTLRPLCLAGSTLPSATSTPRSTYTWRASPLRRAVGAQPPLPAGRSDLRLDGDVHQHVKRHVRVGHVPSPQCLVLALHEEPALVLVEREPGGASGERERSY